MRGEKGGKEEAQERRGHSRKDVRMRNSKELILKDEGKKGARVGEERLDDKVLDWKDMRGKGQL